MTYQKCRECNKDQPSVAFRCWNCKAAFPKMNKEKANITKLLLYGLLTLFIFGLLWPASYVPTERIDWETKISDGAIDTMTPEQYPKTYQEWGDDKVKWLNALQKPAALYTLQNYDCDFVTFVAISPLRSMPPNFVIFNIDCQNGNRYLVSDHDLSL